MAAGPDSLHFQIDQIFTGDQIDNEQLKNFLKLLSSRCSPSTKTIGDNAGEPFFTEEEINYTDEAGQATYLTQLIGKCEERLANLPNAPRTKVLIRTEGKKLETILEQLDFVRNNNCRLQDEIQKLTESQEKFKKLECERKQTYQNMIDRLYTDSMNSDVCKLRKMFYFLHNQVEELTVNYKAAEESINAISNKIKGIECLRLLEEQVHMLLDWRSSLREELELVSERFEHVKTIAASKCEVKDWLEKKVNYCHLANYVPRLTFNSAKEEFIKEFDEMKEHFCDLQLTLSKKLVDLSKSVTMVLSQFASFRRTEKRQ